jgi:ABC-type transport system involved in multi-copper enzyme maturation permease subunit
MSKVTTIKTRLPTSATQVGTITKYELLNYFRSRRFFILLGITVAISAIVTGIVGYYRPSGWLMNDLAFYSNWWGSFATFVIILSGIFFGGDAISGEFQNKTGYFLVGNPIRRASIYIGKWIAAFIASLIVLGVFLLIAVGNGLYYLGSNVPYQLAESFGFAILYLITVLGFTFFFSSLFKSSSMSILVTAILFLFGFNLIETVVSVLAQTEPWFLVTYGAGIIGNILEDPYPSHTSITRIGGPRGETFTTYAVTVPEGIAILVVYFAVTAILGLLLFERKEFT